MNIEKIAVNGHYVWVDKDVTTMTNTPMGYCYNSLKSESDWTDKDIVLHQGTMPIYHYRGLQKIIAASPELHIEDVPTYVRWLARKEFPKDGTQESGYLAGGYVIGYQAAEKELYTEDDIQYFFECGRNFQLNGEVTYKQALDEFKQLKK